MDILTGLGDSGFIRQLEGTMTKLSGLSIRPPKKIKVTGFSFEEDITVQFYEDGVMVECNHAGHEPGIFFIDDELRGRGELCDKCGAWSYDGEEWHE